MVMVAIEGIGEFNHALTARYNILNYAKLAEEAEGAVYAGAVDGASVMGQNRFDGGGVVIL